jgi:hypothetical protein
MLRQGIQVEAVVQVALARHVVVDAKNVRRAWMIQEPR